MYVEYKYNFLSFSIQKCRIKQKPLTSLRIIKNIVIQLIYQHFYTITLVKNFEISCDYIFKI